MSAVYSLDSDLVMLNMEPCFAWLFSWSWI